MLPTAHVVVWRKSREELRNDVERREICVLSFRIAFAKQFVIRSRTRHRVLDDGKSPRHLKSERSSRREWRRQIDAHHRVDDGRWQHRALCILHDDIAIAALPLRLFDEVAQETHVLRRREIWRDFSALA